MIENESIAKGPAISQHDATAIWRLGLWGLAASITLVFAVLIANSEIGARRIGQVIARLNGLPTADEVRTSADIARLTDAIEKLSGDSDRILSRLDTLERALGDLNGSITSSIAPPRPGQSQALESTIAPKLAPNNLPSTTAPPTTIVTSTVPTTTPAPSPTTTATTTTSSAPTNNPQTANLPAAVSQSPPTAPAQDVQAPETPPSSKVDFGIDLGSASNVEGLRTLWSTAKSKHATLLEGLRPIIVVREHGRPGAVELRLVAGPLPTAAMAGRLCVVITATGAVCQPAVYDGQRLALR